MNEKNQGQIGMGFKMGIGICILLALVCIVAGFKVGFWGWQTPRPGSEHLSDLGNLGSYLQGTTASFWSLASVFIIFVAFLLQSADLKRQREQFTAQNESIKIQNFESRFFQLLNLHNQNVVQMRYFDPKSPEIIYLARDCFKIWHKQLSSKYDFYIKIVPTPTELVEKCYLDFYYEHRGELGHYFRTLYHIFKFVNGSSLPDEDKRPYTSLVRAQLSAYELAILFYNGISAIPPEKEKKFKPLIEKFGLMEQIDENLLLDRHHKTPPNFYLEGAYI